MTNSNLLPCKVGDRVECGECFGTIKYIGPIEGKPMTWLGIDWDEADRGKHNGSVNDVQYFTTWHPRSGSFVRPEKVEFGKSALSSILSRYGQSEDEFTAKINQQQQLRIKQTMNAPFLEMVGFEKVFRKQSNFSSLRIVNLRGQNVNAAGSASELAYTCPNIEELDLSKNLLSNWMEILEICKHLENLVWLNVSENVMVIPDNYGEYSYPNIQTLICGYMKLTWEDVCKIASVFSGVEELRVPYNNIQHLSCSGDVFKHLGTLDIEGNKVVLWSEICKFDPGKLEYLIAEDIGLETIKFEGEGPKVSTLRSLRKLCLVQNLIKEWESVGELNRLEALENLKISKNPIFETESTSTAHQLIIAKIEQLKILNGVEIEPGERRGAEYDYLKKYGLEWLKVKGTDKQEEFLKIHNRYLELIERYGELEESELKVESKILRSTLIRLTITYGDTSVVKRLPPSMTVQKLMMLIQKMFNLEERPTLTYVSSNYNDIEIELNDEMKDIGVYSMQDGDQIIVKPELL